MKEGFVSTEAEAVGSFSNHRSAEHTPGPWVVDYGKQYPRAISRANPTDAKGGINAVVRWNGIGFPSSAEGQANARLIAAAPDMLKALQEVNQTTDGQGGCDCFISNSLEDLVRTAIAKATGEQ